MMKKNDFNWFPVALFGSVMGMTGLSSAFRQANLLWNIPIIIANIIGIIAMVAFIALIITYSIKIAKATDSFKAEFNHPITGSLFGTPLISCLLLPSIIAQYNLALAQILWWIGVIAMSIFAWHICTRWIKGGMLRNHATPIWFIPLVGMINIPIAVPSLQFSNQYNDVMIWGLAVGLFFAIPLFTLVFSRLFFQDPLPENLKPSIVLLIAPFSISCVAYINTVGSIDLFAKALFSLTVFIFFILLKPLKQIAHCNKFKLSWWSVSFPMASASNAALKFAEFNHSAIFDIIAILIFSISSIIIFFLMSTTLWAILTGRMEQFSR